MQPTRSRVSSSAQDRETSSLIAHELQLHALVKVLSESVSTSAEAHSPATLEKHSGDLRQIRRLLVDCPSPQHAKDEFRRKGGFEALLDTLQSLKDFFVAHDVPDDAIKGFFELLKCILDVLSEALVDHARNSNYFASTIKCGGWISLQQLILSTGFVSEQIITQNGALNEAARCFELLFSLALREETLSGSFKEAASNCGDSLDGQIRSSKLDAEKNSSNDQDDNSTLAGVEELVDKLVGNTESVCFAEALYIVFGLWRQIPVLPSVKREYMQLSLTTLCLLRKICMSSEHNAVALSHSRIASLVLKALDTSSALEEIHVALQNLLREVVKLGMDHLKDVGQFYNYANNSLEGMDLLLDAVKTSREPAHFQFDQSLCGHAAIEFSDLDGRFPPDGSNAGYTFMCWLRIDHFDKSCHSTVFGAFDEKNTCFVLVYIEKATHQLVLQTSVKSTAAKPSTRFKSFTFRESKWYHVAIVHKRSQSESTSHALLFINGQLSEQAKIQFPADPHGRSGKGFAFPIAGNGKDQVPIQAFFGTPQDLSPRHGRGVLTSKLSIASGYLFSRPLEDELILVYQKLGPRYYGNFQDSLGSFQTYRASAILNMHNEQTHPSGENRSIISQAVRSKAGELNPEVNILIGLSTASFHSREDGNQSVYLAHSKLSRDTLRSLDRYTQHGMNAIAFNTAALSISQSLAMPSGVGIITGGTVVYRPASLDSASWQLAGCVPLPIKLLDSAADIKIVNRSICLFFELIRDSWRNSEAMERENGYSVLALILASKLANFSRYDDSNTSDLSMPSVAENVHATPRSLLEAILGFLGYNQSHPEESVITNPFAYRVLLVDSDIWRTSDCATQKLYYEQFLTFSLKSRFSDFNAKRMSRMRIIKKIIESFKSVTLDREVLPDARMALMALMECTLSSDVLRSVAVYIVYALHRDDEVSQTPIRPGQKNQTLKIPQSGRIPATSRSPSPHEVTRGTGLRITSHELGITVLDTLTDLLCSSTSDAAIRKFAKSVTNKWLIHLFAEADDRIVACASRILAKLLVVHGQPYIGKFEDKTHGFAALSADMQPHWNSQTLWLSCFSVLFGLDVAVLDFGALLDAQEFLKILELSNRTSIYCPSIMVIFQALLEGSTKDISTETNATLEDAMRLPSDQSRTSDPKRTFRISVLPTVFKILMLLHKRFQSFRDFAISSALTRNMVKAFYRAEGKLVDNEAAPSESTINKPMFRHEGSTNPIRVSKNDISSPGTEIPSTQRHLPRRRGSSFVIVPASSATENLSSKMNMPLNPNETTAKSYELTHPISQSIVDFLSAVFLDQILYRKEFVGLGLFLKAPAATAESRSQLNSYLFCKAFDKLHSQLLHQPEVFWQPTSLGGVARFTMQCAEALFEGWFVNGASCLIEFIGALLEYLHSPSVREIKSVRWSAPALLSMQSVLRRATVFWLSVTPDAQFYGKSCINIFTRLISCKAFLVLPEGEDDLILETLCYLLYCKFVNLRDQPRNQAIGLLQGLVKSRRSEVSALLTEASTQNLQNLGTEFVTVILQNDADVASWVAAHSSELYEIFADGPATAYAQFCAEENTTTQKSSKLRSQKRKERVEQWHLEEITLQHILTEHDMTTKHWISNIYSWEALKHLRSRQDQQDNNGYLSSKLQKFNRELERLEVFEKRSTPTKWQLDDVEGPDRVRKRLAPFINTSQEDYKPKRSVSKEPKKLPISTKFHDNLSVVTMSPISHSPISEKRSVSPHNEQKVPQLPYVGLQNQSIPETRDDDFEIVSKPEGEEEDLEDNNRKVMRSLQRGERVEEVCNVSRIRGLEACECLLIQGKTSLYLLENLFQRADGEIVESSQAPKDERDPYMHSISGNDSMMPKKAVGSVEIEAQYWTWPEIISISKRHFLFRDVAVEIFFNDGRSFLFTTISQKRRDSLYTTLTEKATTLKHQSSSIFDESAWRIELLRNPRDATQSLGTKFANVFSHSSLQATKQWMKGEISNFHYLMVINTVAGRTFNDLTQYPVFPWVLADYKSEELDLSDPRSFRDLSKPMGCQTLEREEAYRERYDTYAEMADENAPPFHYGTHYSSAMIVSSYLIRLEPFVQSYLLLQGGTFDHAERLFNSIEGAWLSASRETMTDVRELTPEFFYLPDFLVNLNHYDFGSKSSTGEEINDVKLPPWAKGDPEIFIAKHREALESPYVTEHLHSWIDLIFGYKQRGEAAIEATNVFHYLSYHGAKDLDSIKDELERDATIGIIHNFGQTPRQIFKRVHERKESSVSKVNEPKDYVEHLRRIPSTLFDINEPIAGLWISPKQQRLLCAGPFKTFLPPFYNVAIEWGHTDGSVRYYASQNRQGIFEQLHQEQITMALFADSGTLITASEDCTLAVWSVSTPGDSFNVLPKSSLFGHKTPVSLIATSRKFSTLLSASTDGHVILWDLNRLEPLQEFHEMGKLKDAKINDRDGSIILCNSQKATILTLNGRKLLDQSLCSEEDDEIYSCAFYQPEGSEWIESELVFTGHKRGVVNVWKVIITLKGEWKLDYVARIDHSERSRGDGFRSTSSITCILSAEHSLYTGDEHGKVFQWEHVR